MLNQPEDEVDRISRIRSDLRSKSKDISAEAELESHRILEFLESVFSEDEAERNESCKRLKQSACLGPDLFPDSAIDLILALASSAEFSQSILPVCAEFAGNCSILDARLTRICLNNIDKGLHPELSASVLDVLSNSVSYPLGETHIKHLLLSQDHHCHIGARGSIESNYSHSTTIIVRSFDAEPEGVKNVILRELQNESDYLRINLCGAVHLIQHERPQIAVDLLDGLVSSLELHENERLSTGTPSGRIIQILQLAFRHSAKIVDQFLGESMSRVRPTVQEEFIGVYRDQFFDRSVSWEDTK